MLVYLWEESWDLLDSSLAYHTLRAVAEAVQEFAGAEASGWDHRAQQAVATAMSLVTVDADLYKLISLSDTSRLKAEARAAVDRTREIESVLDDLGYPPWETSDGSSWLAKGLGKIKTVACQNNIFYQALAAAAEALADFEDWLLSDAPCLIVGDRCRPAATGPGSDATRQEVLDGIAAALDRIRGAQQDLRELIERAGLDDRILSRCTPWERLIADVRQIVVSNDGSETTTSVFVPERISIRYCYPFAAEAGDQTRDILHKLLEDSDEAAIDGTLARIGLKVKDLGPMTPTQFFVRGSELYDGLKVDLPEIAVNLGQEQTCKVWLNLCYMGNHCLCIELPPMRDPRPHELYRAVQAGTPFAIGATVDAGAGMVWESLHSFSRDVTEAILRADFWPVPQGPPTAKQAVQQDGFVRGNLHEILIVQTDGPLATRPEDIADRLDGAVGGRILARSIQRAATTLEEWARYPPVPRTRSGSSLPAIAGIPEMGLAGDWCTHTGETTVFGIVAAPSWHSDVYVEAAQFVSSWSPLLRLWSRRLLNAIKTADLNSGSQSDKKLRHIEGQVRLHLAQTKAEELCATLAHRRFLDQLLEMAGLGRLQGELEAQLAAAEHLTDWFSEEARRTDEDNRQKADQKRQQLLGVIALFGLFELGTFLSIIDTTKFASPGAWQVWVMLSLLAAGLLISPYFLSVRVEQAMRQRLGGVARRLTRRGRR
jgi:hypothetical protein